MFPYAPTLFVLTPIAVVAIMLTVGLSLFWILFAVTLVATTLVAVNRSIPRKER